MDTGTPSKEALFLSTTHTDTETLYRKDIEDTDAHYDGRIRRSRRMIVEREPNNSHRQSRREK